MEEILQLRIEKQNKKYLKMLGKTTTKPILFKKEKEKIKIKKISILFLVHVFIFTCFSVYLLTSFFDMKIFYRFILIISVSFFLFFCEISFLFKFKPKPKPFKKKTT